MLTWAVLTTGMIGIRTVTGSELQRSRGGVPVLIPEAVVLGSLCWAYLVVVEGVSGLLVTPAGLAVGVATVGWYRDAGGFESSAEPSS